MPGDSARWAGCSDSILRLCLKTEIAEGESAAVIGSTRLPTARVASPY